MRMLVICGAGVSSTFVAAKICQAAEQQGIEVIAEAQSSKNLSLMQQPDIVLLAEHLQQTSTHSELQKTIPNTPILFLPPVSPEALNAKDVLTQALQAAQKS